MARTSGGVSGSANATALASKIASFSQLAPGDVYLATKNDEINNLSLAKFAEVDYAGAGTGARRAAFRGDGVMTSSTGLQDPSGSLLSVKKPLGRAIQTTDLVCIWQGDSSGFHHHVSAISSITDANNLVLTSACPNWANLSAGNVRYWIGPPNQAAAINAARQQALLEGGGQQVVLLGYYFTEAPVEVSDRVAMRAAGFSSGGFILQDGANCNVVQGHLSTDTTADPGDPNATFVTLEHFGIIANKQGQTASATNRSGLVLGQNGPGSPFLRIGKEVDIDRDRRHRVSGVHIWGALNDGFQAWGLSSSIFEGIQSYVCGRYAFHLGDDTDANGLADTILVAIVGGLCGEDGFFSPIISSVKLLGGKMFSMGENYKTGFSINDPAIRGAAYRFSAPTGGALFAGADAQENRGPAFYLVNVRGANIQGQADSNCILQPALMAAVYAERVFGSTINVNAFDTNWNGDGGTQKHAVKTVYSRRNRLILQHEPVEKNLGTSDVLGVVHPDSDLADNAIEVGSSEAVNVSPWYATAPAAAPTLNAAGSGGSRPTATTVYLWHTWRSASGLETPPSPVATFTSSGANQLVRLQIPARPNSDVVSAPIYVSSTNDPTTASRQSIEVEVFDTASNRIWKEPNQLFFAPATGKVAPPTVPTLRLNPLARGEIVQTLGGNLTIEAPPVDPLTSPKAAWKGQRSTLTLVQDATGGRKVTWGTGFASFTHTWIQNLAPNRQDTVEFLFDGTVWRMVSTAPSLLYAQPSVQAGDTIANSSTITNFASGFTIPAGQLKAGQTIEIEAAGVLSTAAAGPTLLMALRGGSAGTTTWAAASSANTLPATQVNKAWRVWLTLTVLTTGATGTAEIQGIWLFDQSGGTTQTLGVRNTATVTIDTTTDNLVSLAPTWGTADLNNSITQRQLVAKAA